jgi:uncharacterized phiE125 gp8 family phage protein
MPLELIISPSIEPVTYQQVIVQLKMNPYDEDIDEVSIAEIDRLIAAVRWDTEHFLNRALITQTWKYYLDEWPSTKYIQIPKPPLQSITSVTVLTADAVSATLDPIYYLTDTVSNRGRLILAEDESWPTEELYPMNPIQIEFVCGYGDLAENIPPKIIQAMLIQIADLYLNPETIIIGQTIQKLDTVERLLYRHKVWV